MTHAILNYFRKRPLARWRDLQEAGIGRREFNSFLESDANLGRASEPDQVSFLSEDEEEPIRIERIQILDPASPDENSFRPLNGIYRSSVAEFDPHYDLAVAALLAEKGVIWGYSAALFHDLYDMDATGNQIQLLLPHQSRLPYRHQSYVAFTRVRDRRRLEIGVDVESFLGVAVPITNPARTVVDLILYGNVRQHQAAAVSRYLREHSAKDLLDMAREFDASDVIEPMLEVLEQDRDNRPGF